MTSPKSHLSQKLFMAMISIVMLASCAKKDFPETSSVEPEKESLTTSFQQEEFFAYQVAQDFFKQDQYDRNQTSMTFQVLDAQGASILNLGAEQIELTENGRPISHFSFASQNMIVGQKADIVFVVDVSSSMQSGIKAIQAKVRSLVEKLQVRKVDARLCLVTFRDHTEKKCDSWVEDNPQTPNNENLERFLSDVSGLKASAGGDADDNQLRALIDASRAPWRVGAQRTLILVTDSQFHYQNKNLGDAGDDAPFYGDVMTAVKNAQVTLFAVAPSKEGYSKNFQGNPSLAQLTQGQHFSYVDMISSKFSLEAIFENLVNRISLRYTADFVVEENDLDPTLPLAQRDLRVQVLGRGEYRVQVLGISSNQPLGHPEYKKRFQLSRKPKEQNYHLQVKLNGVVSKVPLRFENAELVFETAPPAGATIEVSYDPASLREALTVHPIILPSTLDVPSMVIAFNGQEVPMEELRLSRDSDGNLILDPTFSVYPFDDIYQIIPRQGLQISVEGRISNAP